MEPEIMSDERVQPQELTPIDGVSVTYHNPDFTVFISIPMTGREMSVVQAEFDLILKFISEHYSEIRSKVGIREKTLDFPRYANAIAVCPYYDEGATQFRYVDTIHTWRCLDAEGKKNSLSYLGVDIQLMQFADLVVFAPGAITTSGSKGCYVENIITNLYSIPTMYLIAQGKGDTPEAIKLSKQLDVLVARYEKLKNFKVII